MKYFCKADPNYSMCSYPSCTCDTRLPRCSPEEQAAGQTRRASLIEVGSNYAFGFCIAWLTAAIVLPLFGFNSSTSDNFWITVIFTIVSLIRSYIVRRLFNHLHKKGVLK